MNEQRDFRMLGELKENRWNFEWQWQRISDYVIPRRGDFTVQRSPGQKRNDSIYDSTAPWALNQLSSGMHSLLTSQALPWFYLTIQDQELLKRPEVQAWLMDCENRINAVFNDPGTRFQSQIHETYIDLSGFGTAVIYIDDDSGVRYSTRFLGECYIRQNYHGVVDTLIRVFTLSKDRAIEMFGEQNLPKKLLDDKDEMRQHEFSHFCVPEGNVWASRYYWNTDKFLIREGTYSYFPYAVPRWSKSVIEDYGRSPAMECLPDILMVNEMRRTILRAAHKAVSPPLLVPDGGFIQAINLNPDKINYYDTSVPGDIKFLESKGQFPPAENEVQDSRQAIIRAFFVDMLQLPGGFMPGAKNQNTYMTATEATFRRENTMRVLGPQVSRLQNELLNPLITITFNILKKRRALAPPPQALQGKDIGIGYISPLAIAQKAAEADGFMRLMALLQPIAANRPEILDRLNGDELLEYGTELYHVPQRVLYTPQQMAAMRQQQQNAQAQEQTDNSSLIASRRNLMAAQSMDKMAGAMRA